MIDIRHRLEQAASDEGLPLHTDVPKLLKRARAGRRRHRARTTAVTALSTAVLAVGGVFGTGFLPADSGGGDDPAANSWSANPSLSTTQALEADPGLPPTAQNLYQVLVTADGWTLDSMDNSQNWGGSHSWSNGAQWLDVSWYPARQYDLYFGNLSVGTTERAVELLGQSGHEFTEKPVSASQPAGGQEQRSPKGTNGRVWKVTGETLVGGHRVFTILPAVGDYFLIVDAYTTDKAAFDEVIGSLTRVGKAAWERAIDPATVTEAEGDAFLAEAKRDVPMPEGVEVTVDDLGLPQDPHQARAAFAAPVLCGWAERYVAGDAQALETLRGSSQWPVLQAMRAEGDYAEVVAENIEQLAGGTTDKGNPYTLEHFDLAVGC